jgi:branched-subunit amino acid aminotransferase/4-amino-4-deoxychorismate lyase
MSTTSSSNASTRRLFALTSQGLRELRVEAGAGEVASATPSAVHELLERLPGGVYSALRTFHHNRFLWLEAHLDRTERSMAGLGWPRGLDRPALRAALHRVTSEYPLADSVVRFDVLRDEFELQGERAAVFLALSPFVPVPPEFLRDGVRVDLAPRLHRTTPLIKTTDFVRVRKPMPIGTKERYEHILLDEQRRVLECSSSNVAFVRDGAVLSAGDGVLEGITALVLRHVAGSLGLRWLDERLPIDALEGVDEAFLSSSSRGIVPIVEVEGIRIGDGRVGAVTRRLTTGYYEFAEREAAPAL